MIMGILNVTPDSFSDGGLWTDPAGAVAHGLDMARAGAHIVDVGGESTRPGADPVPAADQIARTRLVVEGLADAGVAVSIDTADPEVASAALAAGAVAVNDVTAFSHPDMAAVVAATGAGVVLMHMQGTPRSMQHDPAYGDVVAEVRDFLLDRAERAEAAGIEGDRITIDPGIGFGKTAAHNLTLLRNLHTFVETPYGVVLGTSRKRFLGTILGGVPPEERDVATAATSALAAAAGVHVLRVHNVAASAQAARVGAAIVRETVEESWH